MTIERDIQIGQNTPLIPTELSADELQGVVSVLGVEKVIEIETISQDLSVALLPKPSEQLNLEDTLEIVEDSDEAVEGYSLSFNEQLSVLQVRKAHRVAAESMDQAQVSTKNLVSGLPEDSQGAQSIGSTFAALLKIARQSPGQDTLQGVVDTVGAKSPPRGVKGRVANPSTEIKHGDAKAAHSYFKDLGGRLDKLSEVLVNLSGQKAAKTASRLHSILEAVSDIQDTNEEELVKKYVQDHKKIADLALKELKVELLPGHYIVEREKRAA